MFKNNKTLSFLWQFAKKYKMSFMLTLIIVIMCYFVELFGTNIILKDLLDGISKNSITYSTAILLGLVFAFCSGANWLIITIKRKISFGYENKIQEDVKNYIFSSLIKQSKKYFTNNFVGTLNSKINDIARNFGSFIDNITDIAANLAGFICSIIIFIYNSPQFAIFFVIWIIFYVSIFIFISSKIKNDIEIATDQESICSGKIVDCFTNIMNIKIFSREKQEKNNIKKYTLDILREKSKIVNLKIIKDIINGVSRILFTTIVVIMSIRLYFNNSITLGDLTFNINVSTSLFMWLKWALESISDNIEKYGKMKQAVNTLIVDKEVIDKQDARQLSIKEGKIEFRNIGFKY